MNKIPLPRPRDNYERFLADFTAHMRRNGHTTAPVLEAAQAIESLRQRFAEGRRVLFAAGRIPSRRTSSGTTLRLVAVVGQAALKITTVQPPVGPRAA